MMCKSLVVSVLAVSLVGLLSAGAGATVLNFALNDLGAVPPNNSDITVNYGSNVTAGNVIGATDGGEGFTPNIGLTWYPTGGTVANEPDIDVLEFHSAGTFAGAGFTVPVLQLDVDISNHTALPDHPRITFTPDPGYSVRIHDLKIGNATDQTAGETPHPWVISILELPGETPTGVSYITAALGAGDLETATFNFTGSPGVSYQLLFDDGDLSDTSFAAHNPRTGIDDIRFSQVAIPEPNSIALVLFSGAAALVSRKRR